MGKFPNIEAAVGGQISIDIYEKGCNKAQVLDDITGEICFFGDKMEKGGNDYPLARIMHEEENCSVFQAGAPSAEDGYKDTQRILEKLDTNE